MMVHTWTQLNSLMVHKASLHQTTGLQINAYVALLYRTHNYFTKTVQHMRAMQLYFVLFIWDMSWGCGVIFLSRWCNSFHGNQIFPSNVVGTPGTFIKFSMKKQHLEEIHFTILLEPSGTGRPMCNFCCILGHVF